MLKIDSSEKQIDVLMQYKQAHLRFSIPKNPIESIAPTDQLYVQWKALVANLIKPNLSDEDSMSIGFFNNNGSFDFVFNFEDKQISLRSYHFGFGVTFTLPLNKAHWLEIAGHAIAMYE